MAWNLYRNLGILVLCCGYTLFDFWWRDQVEESEAGAVGGGALSQSLILRNKHQAQTIALWIPPNLNHDIQQSATVGLQKLHNNASSPFETAFSSVPDIIASSTIGFPLRWHSCTLQPLLENSWIESQVKKTEGVDSFNYSDTTTTTTTSTSATDNSESVKPLHIVVLGGSSSAHAAKLCNAEGRSRTPTKKKMFITTTNSTNNSSSTSSVQFSSSRSTNAGGGGRGGGGEEEDLFAGRYSNILDQQLNRDFQLQQQHQQHQQQQKQNQPSTSPQFPTFNVINMAQGASDTVWNALMLDELVDAANLLHGADVLIVEYGINDALGGTTKQPRRTDEHLAQMMNFWLWRVWSLFRNEAGRDPPPILFVYLWDADVYRATTTIEDSSQLFPGYEINRDKLLHRKGLGQTSWMAQHAVLEYYRNLGWSIGAINVGAIVNATVVADNPGTLLDDKHHPNCEGMHVITAMIRHALYTDLTHCSATDDSRSKEQQRQRTMDPALFRPMNMESNNNKSRSQNSPSAKLLHTLLDKNVTVGSIMEWEPNVGSSSLVLGTDSEVFNASHVEEDVGTKSYPWRADRKQSFTLPLCPSVPGYSDNEAVEAMTSYQETPIHFTLLEPNLKWIGIGYRFIAQNEDAEYFATIEMKINDEVFVLTDKDQGVYGRNRTVLEFDQVEIVKDWFRIADFVQQPPPPKYSICFCYRIRKTQSTFTSDIELHQKQLLGACPFENATNIQEVCSIWNEMSSFDASRRCPYEQLQTVSKACFEWVDTELDRIQEQDFDSETRQRGEETEKNSSPIIHPPQLNWIVGVVKKASSFDNP